MFNLGPLFGTIITVSICLYNPVISVFSGLSLTLSFSFSRIPRLAAQFRPRPISVVSLHRKMSSPAIRAAQAALASVDLSSYDPEQSRLMDERCILVDENDNAIGAVDKKTCKSTPSS